MKAVVSDLSPSFVVDQNTGEITMDGQKLHSVRFCGWSWDAGEGAPVLSLDFVASNVEVIPVKNGAG